MINKEVETFLLDIDVRRRLNLLECLLSLERRLKVTELEVLLKRKEMG